MFILVLRTDKPEAEIGIFDNDKELYYSTWAAHRQLAETIHRKIDEVLRQQNLTLKNIQGLVVYKGPGSFTGLRIGLSVANALAYSKQTPVVAAGGNNWQRLGIDRLLSEESDTIALPEYGAPVFTTEQKK